MSAKMTDLNRVSIVGGSKIFEWNVADSWYLIHVCTQPGSDLMYIIFLTNYDCTCVQLTIQPCQIDIIFSDREQENWSYSAACCAFLFHFSLIWASPSNHISLSRINILFSKVFVHHFEDLFPVPLLHEHCAGQKSRSVSCYCINHPDVGLRGEYDLTNYGAKLRREIRS